MAPEEGAGYDAGREYFLLYGRPYAVVQAERFDELKLDSGSFEQAPLIQGSFLFLKKSEQSLRILREWMDLCRQFKLVSSATTEEESRCRDNFVAHTHDQTLLSLVAAQHHLDCLYSGKGVIHLEGRRAFERHPGFDDKDPDWFLEELGAKKAEHPLMPVLCCMQQAFFLYEKAMNKLMKLAGLRPLRGFYG